MIDQIFIERHKATDLEMPTPILAFHNAAATPILIFHKATNLATATTILECLKATNFATTIPILSFPNAIKL